MELNTHTWWTIFRCVTLDLAAPYLPRAGLRVVTGWPGAAELLRESVSWYRGHMREESQGIFIARTFAEFESRFGAKALEHLVDWGEWVYPQGPRHDRIARWMTVVDLGLGGSSEGPIPKVVADLKHDWDLGRVDDDELEGLTPTSDWDRLYWADMASIGDDDFQVDSWIQTAIDKYRFLLAYWLVNRSGPVLPNDLDAMTFWGQAQAARIGVSPARLGRPETCLEMPESLRPDFPLRVPGTPYLIIDRPACD